MSVLTQSNKVLQTIDFIDLRQVLGPGSVFFQHSAIQHLVALSVHENDEIKKFKYFCIKRNCGAKERRLEHHIPVMFLAS